MDIDPFKKYGGQQTRSDQTAQDDPFSKYGGSIIKKKEDGGAPSVPSAPVASPTKSPLGNEPDEYGRPAWMKGLPPPSQLPESTDPLNDALVIQQQKLNEAKSKSGFEGFTEAKQASKNIKDITSGKVIPNGDAGGQLLSKLTNENPDNLSKEQIEQIAPKTLTGQAAKNSYLSLRNLKESVYNNPDLGDAAIDVAIKNGDKGLEALRNSLGGNTSNIKDETKGAKLTELFANQDFQHLVATDPDVRQKYKEELFNLPNHYPQYAATVVKQLIADKLEKNHDNNWFYNITSKDKADKIVDDAIASGELPNNYKSIYEDYVKPKLNTWQQLIHGNPISTPGLLENINEGAQNMFFGTGKSAAELLGIRDLIKSPTEQLSETVNKDYNTTHVSPIGLLHKTTMHGGQLLGAMGETMATAGGSEALMPLAFGLGVMGDYNDQSKKMFPSNPLKQAVYTNVMTGLNIWGAKFLPGQKLLESEEPEIVNTLKGIMSGEIPIETGKDKIINGLLSTAKGAMGGGEFMAATTAADDILSNALQNKKVDLGQTAEKAWGAFQTGLLSTAFLAGAEAALRTNKGLGEQIYAVASNPEHFREVVADHVPKEQQADILSNIDFVAQTKKHLDSETELNDKQKQKYISIALRQRILENKSNAIADKQLRGTTEKKIAETEIEKERILNPEVGNKKFIEEMYDNELLPKADNRMLEDENGKFSEHKVGDYLKYVAQQANNLDENWQPHTTKAPDVSHIPDQVIEAANERWHKEIEAAKYAPQPEAKPTNDFEQFKNHILEHVANVKDNSFDFRITTGLDQKGIEQAVRNIKEGKDTKAAQTLLASIKEMYDDGHVYLNTAAGGKSQSIQIPLKEYMAEVNKPLKVEDLDELNTLLGEDSFNSTFDNAYDYETKRSTEGSQTPTATEGTAGENTQTPSSGEGAPPITPEVQQEQQPAEVTGVKKAITNPLRQERGLPRVELPKVGSDIANLQTAKERVDNGESDPIEMVNRILDEKSGYHNENEVWDMQYYAHQLKAKEDQLRNDLTEAQTPEEKNVVSNKILQLSDEVDRQTEAAQVAGNQWHKVGMGMQPVIDIGFNPAREKLFIKEAYGGEIPKEVQTKLDETIKQRDEAIAERDRIKEQLNQKLAKAGMDEIKKTATRAKRQQVKEELLKEEKDLLDQLKKAIRRDLGNLHSGIPLPKETLETLGKLAVNYFKQGFVTLEQLVDKLHSELKDEADISKKDIRDFISDYQPAVEQLQAQKLTKKAEKLETQIRPPILKTVKGKLQGVSEEPSFAPSKKRQLVFRNNTDWAKANQRVINAEAKIRTLKRQAFESQKNLYQKALMWGGRLVRLSILSGKNVLYKLAAAATVGGALKRIPEQAIGAIWSKVFKGIAEKAPIEGYLNAKSEAKFYTEFFNPKKFVKNSWEIIKSGESNLTKKFSTGQYEHVPGLYLPTDLHQILKDPLKRGTYEASFRNAMIWAEKNGLDISDPLVINSLETAAYKRANYEIFQERNWLSRKFQDWKNKMEKSGNVGATGKFLADFMIPVSTVPTNIARRLITTSPAGLIRGSKMVVDAYRNGIEKLSADEADHVMRQLKQGSLGTALWLIGWLGYESYGGLFSKYDPNKKRKEGELASDEMEVNGQMIPKPVQHALPLEIIQWAATARHIYNNYSENKGAGSVEAITNAGLGSIGALAEQIPIIETGVRAVEAGQDPYQGEKLKEDVKRRFEPQILRETGVIPTPQKQSKGSKLSPKGDFKQHSHKQLKTD